jgi:polyprenyl P-hydroxybenzoate/phenylacrylic acid decarboxylase-like protein
MAEGDEAVSPMTRVFLGITGASGVIYGIKVLELLKKASVEIHLSISKTAEKVIRLETDYDVQYVKSLADYVWPEDDLTAPPASGSFGIDAVAVVPSSTKTLAAIANGITLNLITRFYDRPAVKARRRGWLQTAALGAFVRLQYGLQPSYERGYEAGGGLVVWRLAPHAL